MKKYDSFLEIAKLLNRKMNVTPLLFGSLGLEKRLNMDLQADDIDILVPEFFLQDGWNDLSGMMEQLGYQLFDLHEHAFRRNGCDAAFASVEGLQPFAGVVIESIPQITDGEVSYLLLDLPDYRRVYEASSKDGYRVKKKEKKDHEKIALIDSVLRAKRKKVTVEPYQACWKSAFNAIALELNAAVGHLVLGIEHVGSTSVEGLSAKPIIDIDVIIPDDAVFAEVVERLQGIGYQHEGNLGIKDREAFKYEGKTHLMRHHLYVCPQNSAELHRHITFRDYLRSHPEAVAAYSRVKEEGARLYPDSMEQYIAHKTPCILELYSRCGLR